MEGGASRVGPDWSFDVLVICYLFFGGSSVADGVEMHSHFCSPTVFAAMNHTHRFRHVNSGNPHQSNGRSGEIGINHNGDMSICKKSFG